jgi:hypothetical protein
LQKLVHGYDLPPQGLHLQPAASYVRNVSAVKALADAIANPTTAQPVAAVPVKQKLRVTVSTEDTPPSQVLKVVANRQVEVSRVEYMLSNETTIASDDAARQGESVEIPINTSLLTRVWNTPRADRNFSDHSGPAKIAITASTDGGPHQYVLPVQMDSCFTTTRRTSCSLARRPTMDEFVFVTRRPHSRHWEALAGLVGVPQDL